MTTPNADVAAVLSDPDLEQFLQKYGDGPPYLPDSASEVIWRLVGYVRAARRAAGIEASR